MKATFEMQVEFIVDVQEIPDKTEMKAWIKERLREGLFHFKNVSARLKIGDLVKYPDSGNIKEIIPNSESPDKITKGIN